MKNSETGEFEIPVGSRQMLSVFFVVVLLVGVAFAMGYVVGQNTHSARVETAAQAAPAPLEPARQIPPSANAAAMRAPAVARSEGAPSAAPAPQLTPASESAEPAPGTYWQVKALRKNGAEAMVQKLKDMGLPAVMSPSPAKPALMRVLVGPYNDTETMGQVKTQLEKAGMHPIRNNLK